MQDKKPDRIIIISAAASLNVSSSLYAKLHNYLRGIDIILLTTPPSSDLFAKHLSAFKAETPVQKIIKWHDDMEFLAEEEKSLQPTNPYFGKEKWKKNRKR